MVPLTSTVTAPVAGLIEMTAALLPVAPANRPVPPVTMIDPVVAVAWVTNPVRVSPLAAVLTNVSSGLRTAVRWPRWVALPSYTAAPVGSTRTRVRVSWNGRAGAPLGTSRPSKSVTAGKNRVGAAARRAGRGRPWPPARRRNREANMGEAPWGPGLLGKAPP